MVENVENPSRDRPATEIEVTEEMLAAGEEIFNANYIGEGVYDVSDVVMAQVYRAMASARPLLEKPVHRMDARACILTP